MAPVTLSSSQLAQFQKDGFLVLTTAEHKFVDPKDLQTWTAEVRDWPLEKGKWMPYHEVNTNGESQLMRTEKFVDYHQPFYDFLCGEDMASVLKQLSGEDMLLFKDKINYKLPFGNGFKPHLDAPAYDHIGKIEHLTANLAVDDADMENGCLEVVPGSHKMEVQFRTGGHITEEWENKHEWLPVPLKQGDILFFGSHLAHRSGPNKTPRRRSMVYATYHGKSDGLDLREKYYVDRRANFPPEHERIEGKDYSSGWTRYAFAAPFSNQGISSPEQAQSAKVH